MKNVLKLNKKGFTLVELLAVIVILALLIVITANTVLPMMTKSRQNAMVVYAERVLNTASSFYQADSITSDGGPAAYSIAKLMGEDNYFGCVKVDKGTGNNSDGYVYSIQMYKNDDELKVVKTDLTTVTFDGAADTIAVDYEEGDSFNATSYESHDLCKDIYSITE